MSRGGFGIHPAEAKHLLAWSCQRRDQVWQKGLKQPRGPWCSKDVIAYGGILPKTLPCVLRKGHLVPSSITMDAAQSRERVFWGQPNSRGLPA